MKSARRKPKPFQAPAGVTIVSTEKEARRALNILHKLRGTVVSQDVETIDVDLEIQSPVDHGKVICFSMYAGKDVDFGNGPMLWVDTLDGIDPMEFEDFFHDEKQLLTAHNWGFDFHQFARCGLRIGRPSFWSDTLHTSRLLDSGRTKYSLESLTEDYLGDRKVPMVELFGVPNVLKNGKPGKKLIVPPNDEIQRGPQRAEWIGYSVGDTRRQWKLDRVLLKHLDKMSWGKERTQKDLYFEYWQSFGYNLLLEEQRGIYVNRGFLAEIQPIAEADRTRNETTFKKWVSRYSSEAVYMNPNSDQQLQVLLFGGSKNLGWKDEAADAIWGNKDPKEGNVNQGLVKPGFLPKRWTFEVLNTDDWIDPNSKFKKAKKKRPMTLKSLRFKPDADEKTDTGWPKVGGRVLDRLAGEPDRWRCVKCKKAVRIEKGETACKDHAKAKLEPRLGAAAQYYDNPKEMLAACRALQALAEVGRIDTLLSNFIIPIQALVDKRGRVHTSLNLNTESGRISSRRPNNQNQPANEKDRYGIRDAFEPQPLTEKERRSILRKLAKRLGRTPTLAEARQEIFDNEWVFVVSDFSNLELRIAAHITNCQSMIDAFKAGGDFHSRTAMGMFEYIRDAVEQGKVLVDWNGDGKAPLPLIKEAFPTERQAAKVFNFSILYGKTVYGLAKDLGVTEQEAKRLIDLWFSDRPEVRNWIDRTINKAYKLGYVTTLIGRRRPVPQLMSSNKSARKHGERVVTNTPIQGGAADIVMAAMNRIEACERLKKLGARLLLQIHDELIMEVRRKHAVKAQKLKVHYMNYPLGDDVKHRVDYKVDSKIGLSWKECK